MAKLVIHAGTGKTGTSSIQVSMLRNKEKLATQGIVFLESNQSKSGKSAKHGFGWQDSKSQDWKELSDEAARLRDKDLTVVYSNEAFWKKSPRQLRLFKKAFRGFEFQIIIYVRDQAEFLESRTLQSLKKGRKVLDLDFSDPENPGGLDEFLNQFLPHLDYLKTTRRLEKVFGNGTVHARHYARDRFPGGNVVADFFEAIGADTEFFDLSTETNPSLSVPFAVITTSPGDYLPNTLSRSEIIDAGLRLSKKHRASSPKLISSTKAQEIRRRFAKSNRVFFQKHVVNSDGFPATEWQSGDARDFHEYAKEMVALTEEWPLIRFNDFGPKKMKPNLFCEGWKVEGSPDGFSALQTDEEAKIRFRIHLRARSRWQNGQLNLRLHCTEPKVVRIVKIGGSEIGKIDLASEPIQISSEMLGEFDNAEITLRVSRDEARPLEVIDLELSESSADSTGLSHRPNPV